MAPNAGPNAEQPAAYSAFLTIRLRVLAELFLCAASPRWRDLGGRSPPSLGKLDTFSSSRVGGPST
jgi:hypothetical protein